MADPGFPRGGGANSKGGCEKLLFSQFFPQNSIKLKEFGPRRRAPLAAPPPRSANEHIDILLNTTDLQCYLRRKVCSQATKFSPSLITARNEVTKVMFLHLTFCSQGGVCLIACWDTTPPPRPGTPQSRHHPPPGAGTPPGGETATAADGMHPTGMHSCIILYLRI